jgi:IclR family acetate operon transcriptional repressor
MEQPGPPATYRIESVDKALRLLWLLQERPRVTVTDASAELGVARSTAHRLLAMLQEHGFASQDVATRAYLPGRALLEIGLAAVRNLDVRAVARPELERLVADVRETVQLVLLKGSRTLVLDSVECAEIVRVTGRAGGSLPPHCTSAGKSMLARMSDDEVEALLGPDPLERLTDRSIGTHAELRAELARVRAEGYATNLGENEPAIAAVGVAIDVPRGSSPTAITVTAPYERLRPERVPEIAAAAAAASERISARLAG